VIYQFIPDVCRLANPARLRKLKTLQKLHAPIIARQQNCHDNPKTRCLCEINGITKQSFAKLFLRAWLKR
jgi:hypothetical protein